MVLLTSQKLINDFSSTLNSQIDWFEKIIEVRQVTKVGKGKKRLSFRIVILIGNKRGCIGLGIGKDTVLLTAKLKGLTNAKKNIFQVLLTSSSTIPNILLGKFKKSLILLKPKRAGSGIRAGQTIRAIAELVGIQNLSSKQLGSNNVLNNAIATISALKNLC